MELNLKYEDIVELGKIIALPTGLWRYQKPVINVSKCSQCGWCYIYCPTGSITQEANCFSVDLNFCKGCGICASVCPTNAIAMIGEGE